MKIKTKLMMVLLFSMVVFNSVSPSLCQYSYEITWNTGELTRWGGHLWTIKTSTTYPPGGEFDGSLVDKSSIEVKVTYNYEGETISDVPITPVVIVRTTDTIYMLFSYDDFCPYDSTEITTRVTGELETGETFMAFGPGPGFMRRP